MATYCFRCKVCDARFTLSIPSVGEMGCTMCGAGVVVRDYRAEGVGVQVVALQRERERGGSAAVRDLFLPTAKELAGPGDPDGHKAIREWNDTHDPKPGNSRPLRPESPRMVY